MATAYLYKQHNKTEDGINRYYLKPCNLDDFLNQVHAEIIEFAEGNLIDNMMIGTDYGMMILKEKFATTWTSTYEVLIPEDQSSIWDLWDELFPDDEEEEN